MSRILVAGAGQAAGELVSRLRQQQYTGDILMLGEEPQLPYQRPPLSKAYLTGEQQAERLLIRPQEFYTSKNIEVRTSTQVTAIDPHKHLAILDDGSSIAWDKLVLATGSRPRRLGNLPGSELSGVHYLRTRADADAISGQTAASKRLVIIGGGYIGLEVAASARKLDMQVTVLETEPRILQRVTGAQMSEFYHNVHTEQGVQIKTGVAATELRGDTCVSEVLCNDGSSLPADLVIIGVGILPNVELAQEAKLECENGITVDEHCRTSHGDIYAIGDCANHPNRLLDRRLRLESVPNAMEQARVVAQNLSGTDAIYNPVPWFWSDQYDLKLQMVGFSTDADEQVLRGTVESKSFARFYLSGGVLIAIDAVNRPAEFTMARELVGQQAHVDAELLADESLSTKEVLEKIRSGN